MFDYLKQFKSLPKELREKISSQVAMKTLSDLEEKYNVTLASTVMKVMVKDIAINNLSSHLVSEFSLSPESANKLSNELKEKLFFVVAGYLGLKPSLEEEEKLSYKIIKEAKVNFSNPDLTNRCRHLLTTYLRGIRSRVDTRLAFEKPVKFGGLGLDKETADHLLKTCSFFIANLESKPKEEIRPPISSSPLASADVLTELIERERLDTEKAYDLEKELKAGRTPSLSVPKEIKKIEAKKEFKSLASPKQEAEPEKESVEEKKEPKEEEKKEGKISFAPPPKSGLISGLFKSTKKPVIPPAPQAPAKEGIRAEIKPEEKPIKTDQAEEAKPSWSARPRPASDSGAKTKMEDIKTAPKVMGPIDELHYLDLINFRRLGESPEETTEKIKKKIELLEQEGYDRRLAGVKAWKKSPVSRLYIQIGQEAISQGISIKKAAENRQAENKESLSWEEIKAIVSLNSLISF